jgi:hypothetical protein
MSHSCACHTPSVHAVDPQPRAIAATTSMCVCKVASRPPQRAGCSTRVRPASFSSATFSSSNRRAAIVRCADFASVGARRFAAATGEAGLQLEVIESWAAMAEVGIRTGEFRVPMSRRIEYSRLRGECRASPRV